MSQTPRLTEQDVIQYLEDHRDFFIGKDDLLADMRVPHNSGSATSLVERQLAVHRERNVELRQRLSDLLENARRNDQLFGKSRRLILALVEAENWHDVQAALDDSLRKDFDVDAWAMLHFTERQLEPPLLAIHNNDKQRSMHRLFKGHRAICGQLPESDIASLLGLQETECRSVAAAQIRGKGNLGILAIASEDP
ncbi:MAG: DUF484 family protein, partial [Oleibacter sp.]|nr:DUF484 family protein [Thalassolituus sp.]